MRTVRWPALIAGVVLSFPLPTMAGPVAPAAGPTLPALVEQAWQRSVAVKTLDARQDEASAGRAVARSWLAGAPTLGLSERSGRWTGDRAQHETEISVAAPVLLPGQQSARQQLAARGTDEVQAQLQRARLEVAGAVRARLWEAAAARELVAEKEGHLHHLEELRDEVRRRVAAGDLARSDGLLADQDVLAAQGDIAQARGRLREALGRFELLTGVAELPPLEPEPEPPNPPAAEQHARLRAAEASEHRARAAVGLASASVQGAPTVALSMRRERDSDRAGADRSIGIAVQIPLGGQVRNRPAETQAATQLATAAAELSEARASIAIEQSQARSQLAYAREALQAANARAALMREHTALFEKAFKQGERGLAELLRSRTLSHEAEIALRQQRVALGMAHAQLNQVLGILP